MYYQVNGLKRGETIQTTIDIAPAHSSKGRHRAASTFTGQAQGERERREIGLGGLKPGAYVLTVTVHAGSGTVARAASMVITKH